MYYSTLTMTNTFEAEKNRKAFIYTAIIVGIILLIAIFIKWPLLPAPAPVAQDLVEINLGNFDEGMGEVQPLIKGEKAPDLNPPEDNKQEAAASNNEPQAQQPIEDSKDEDAAPIDKPDKIVKTTTPPKNPTTQPVKTVTQPAVIPAPKPRVPKIPGYQGNKGGTGNGATEDNGYKYQGNKTGTGDKGDPSGNPDSYGNNKGGKIGGPLVKSGDRKVINYKSYNFTDELDRAIINALVKVSEDGVGRFAGFGKGSTQTGQAYANAIARYLQKIQFDKSDHESTITVQFNFNVN
jgi:hypothetical protein